MAETASYFDNKEDYAMWWSESTSGINKIKLFLEKYPNEVTVISDDTDRQGGGIMVQVPKKWYRDPKPPKTVNLTEEQKLARSELMKKAREAKNESK